MLFIDDDPAHIRTLIRQLSRLSAQLCFEYVSSIEEGLQKFRSFCPEVCVVDLTLDEAVGPQSGLQFIQRLLQEDSIARILVLTGHGAESYGVQALRCGAGSYLEKPVSVEHLFALICDGAEFIRLKRENERLERQQCSTSHLGGLQSASEKMQHVLHSTSFAASNRQPVLITGETGTGKGVIAKVIHQASAFKNGPFIRFQPTFGGQDLVRSELFGHRRGAFTGALEDRRGLLEEVDRGTLFIDEVDELPHETQVALLNVLQEGMFRPLGKNKEQASSFRLLCATNRPVEEMLLQNKLRRDFFHRIAHFQIEIPPLRERVEDIDSLAKEFLTAIASRERLPVQGFEHDALARLLSYSWPGNVRELQAVVEGAVYRAHYHGRLVVSMSDLNFGGDVSGTDGLQGTFRDAVRNYEFQLVTEALQRAKNNQTLAAKELGLDRTSFRRILKRG